MVGLAVRSIIGARRTWFAYLKRSRYTGFAYLTFSLASRATGCYSSSSHNGWWRSLVAHLTGGQGVAGSNPVHPTRNWEGPGIVSRSFFLRVGRSSRPYRKLSVITHYEDRTDPTNGKNRQFAVLNFVECGPYARAWGYVIPLLSPVTSTTPEASSMSRMTWPTDGSVI